MKRTKVAAILILAAGVLANAVPAQAQAQMYWRIDAGWSAPRSADFKDNDFYNSGNIWTGSPTDTQPGAVNNIDGSPTIGAGVGYRFAGGLRGDVTFAYRPNYTLDGQVRDDFGMDLIYRADITSMTLMVNGYYDFTYGGVRPYIGAGIGYARNKTDKLIQDFRTGFVNTYTGATRDDTAFALMAGIGIPYSGGTLDIGLRYIDMGKFETGNTAALGITGGHTGKLSAYELTVGVRF